MSNSLEKKQASSGRKSGAMLHLIPSLWQWFGNVLQSMHQKRVNRYTYAILLENDDYLLRDIGVSRETIRKIRPQSGNFDASREFEKIQATNGRLYNRPP